MATIQRELHARVGRGEELYELDEERIRSLAPTIVISQGLCPVCATTSQTVGPALGQGRAAAARLLVLSPRTLSDVAGNLREVGQAIGRPDAGASAARAFERRLERVRSAPRPRPSPRVAVIEWFEPLWISGDWIAEMVEVAGGIPLLAGPGETSRRASWDELAQADPEVIVLAACSMTIERAERELGLLSAHGSWRGLRAVRSRRVFLMDGAGHFSTAGPRLAEGVELLHRILGDPDGVEALRAGAWKRVVRP
jgi:iron complex transport system substrate-binding protein